MDKIAIYKKSKFRYRLGDLVLLQGDAVCMVMNRHSPFHNTIGHEYAELMLKNNTCLDFDSLREIIKRHTIKNKYTTSMDDELVVHIRAGDRKRVNSSEVDILLDSIGVVLDDVAIKRVVIVTAFHFGNPIVVSDDLLAENYGNLNKLITGVEKMGVDVSVKSSGDIDEDFCYLVNSKHFMPSKGGFSMVAGVCNENNVYSSLPNTDNAIKFYKKIRSISLMSQGGFKRTAKAANCAFSFLYGIYKDGVR